jgi:hypothetical protein
VRSWFAVGALAWAALTPGSARAAIAHQQVLSDGGSDIDQLFFVVTVPPGEQRLLLLAATTMVSGARVAAASYGGAALAFVAEASAPGGGCRVEWWALAAPPVGANQLRLQLSGTTPNLGVAATSYTGVDPQRPIGGVVGASGASGPIAVTVPSAPGELVLDGACGYANDATIARAGTAQTARWHWSFGPHQAAGSESPGAASVAMTWTTEGPGMLDWASAGIALRPAPQELRLAVDTVGCAVAGPGGHESAGLAGTSLLILLLPGCGAMLARRRKRTSPGNIGPGMA